MNESDHDLLQRVLEGDASPDETARLEARMAADPALRVRFDSMAALVRALGEGPLEQAPANLRGDVLRALAADAHRPLANAGRGGWSWRRLILPLATAATAVALVVFTLRMVPSPLAPDSRTAGTMAGALPQPVQLELPVEGAAVRLAASRDGKGSARLELATDVPVRVSFSSVRGSVEFTGLASPAGNPEPVPPSKERLDWYLKPGVTLRVRCASGTTQAALVDVRIAAPGRSPSEIGIQLESLPLIRLP